MDDDREGIERAVILWGEGGRQVRIRCNGELRTQQIEKDTGRKCDRLRNNDGCLSGDCCQGSSLPQRVKKCCPAPNSIPTWPVWNFSSEFYLFFYCLNFLL